MNLFGVVLVWKAQEACVLKAVRLVRIIIFILGEKDETRIWFHDSKLQNQENEKKC